MKFATYTLMLGLVFLAVRDLHGQLRVQALGDITLAVTDDKTYAFTNPAYLSALSQPTTFVTVGRRGGTQRSEQALDYALDTGIVSQTRPRDPDHRTDRTTRSDWRWAWGGLLNWKDRRLRGSRIGVGVLVSQDHLAFDQTARVLTAGRWVRDSVRQAYVFDADFWKESRTHVDSNGASLAAIFGIGIEWGPVRAGLAGTMSARNRETRNQVRFTNSEGFLLASTSAGSSDAAWNPQAFRMGWAYRVHPRTVVEGYLVFERDLERQQPAASVPDSVTGQPPERVRYRDQRRAVVLRSIQQVGGQTRLVQQLGLQWGDGDVRTPTAAGHRSEDLNTLEIRAGLGFSSQLRPETLLVGEAHGTWNDATRAAFETSGTKLADTKTDTTELRVSVGIEHHVRTAWALRIGMVSQHHWFHTEDSRSGPATTVPVTLSTAQSQARQIQLTAGLGYRYRSFLEVHYAFRTLGTLIDDGHAVEITMRF